LQQGKRDRGAAVDELAAELRRGALRPGKMPRSSQAVADAAAGLKNQPPGGGAARTHRLRKPRSAGANDDYVGDE